MTALEHDNLFAEETANVGDFRLMDREVVDEIARARERRSIPAVPGRFGGGTISWKAS